MSIIVWLVFPGLMIAAALHDIRSFKIPNRIVLAMLGAWPLGIFAMGMTLNEIATALALAGLVLAVGIGLFARNLLGAGDVKLITAATLWLGGVGLPPFLVITALSGAVLAVALVLYRRMPVPNVLLGQEWALNLHQRQKVMPYGVAIATGGVFVWLQMFSVSNVSF